MKKYNYPRFRSYNGLTYITGCDLASERHQNCNKICEREFDLNVTSVMLVDVKDVAADDTLCKSRVATRRCALFEIGGTKIWLCKGWL